MALAYLIDPQLQISDKSGALNVAGFLRVYLNGTDDRAVTYKDFNGTMNPADIVLDNNGRAVVIADSTKAYRLEVYTSDGDLLWTQYPINTIVGGSGGANGFVVESTDGSIAVDRYDSGGVIHYDLSATDNLQLEWTRTDSYTIEESADGTFIVPVNQAEGNMTVDAYGIHLTGGTHYNVSVYVNIDSPSEAVNRFEGIQFRLGGINAPVAEYTVNDSFEHRQTACISCDIHPASDTVFKIHVDGVVNGSELSCNQCTIHSLASYYSGGGTTEYTSGTGIVVDNAEHTISVDNTVAMKSDLPDLTDYVTESELQTTLSDYATDTELSNGLLTKQDVLTAGSNITISGSTISATDTTYSAGTGVDITNNSIGVKIDGSTITTNASGELVANGGGGSQVQSDWTEDNSADPSYIQHKPDTKQIVAGANITITDTQGQITISSAGAGGVPVQADWSQQDSSQLDYIKHKPNIPDAQVQSNWTEQNNTSKSFILNKPATKSIVAGTGIAITETATEIIISLA